MLLILDLPVIQRVKRVRVLCVGPMMTAVAAALRNHSVQFSVVLYDVCGGLILKRERGWI